MKKSLIAVAVAGLFAAPVVMAEVTIKGAIVGSVVAGNSSDGRDAATDPSARGFSNNGSHVSYSNISIGSVDDLGNGMSVIFNFDMNLEDAGINRWASPQSSVGSRNSHIGLKADWGTIKLGNNENSYEALMYTSDFIDGAQGPGGNLLILGNPGVGTAFDQSAVGCGPAAAGSNCTNFYRRTANTVTYNSANLGGFKVNADYTLGNKASTPTGPGGAPQVVSLSVKFSPEGSPFFVDAGYEMHNDFGGINQISADKGVANTLTTSTEDTGMQVGGGMTFGDFAVNLRWENLTYEGNGTGTDLTEWERDAYFINGKMTLPTGYAAVQFGIADGAKCKTAGGPACIAADTGATMIGIAYVHTLSKQSAVHFIYNQTDNDRNANYAAVGGTNGVNGADHKGFVVGLKHTF